MAEVNIPAEGRIGSPAPPGAPHEFTQPLTLEAIGEMQQKARVNERQLQPLTYGKGQESDSVRTAREAYEAALSREAGGQAASHEVPAPKAVEAAPGYPDPATVPPTPVPAKSAHPAASESDTPSRGLPGTAPIPKERKFAPLQVTGGFGAIEDEYFPLNGTEVLALIDGLMDDLHARIQNDLRFSLAITYPRLSAKVQIVIESEVDDQKVLIEKKLPPNGKWDRTPLEVAQTHGDSVVFVVVAERKEFSADGQSETPADAIRAELDLVGPRKRSSGAGVGKSFYDIDF